MKAKRDPEGAEVCHLISTCELAGKTILEIGCGEGKLTRQYARMPRKVVGIDPEKSDLLVAEKKKAPQIHFSSNPSVKNCLFQAGFLK